MVHVVHIVWQMNPGGIEMLVRDLCKRGSQLGIKQVIVEIGPETGQMVKELRDSVCSVYRCPLNPKWSFVPRLSRLLKELSPKAIHHHASGTAVMSAIASRLAGVRCIVETAHSLYRMKGWRALRQRFVDQIFSYLITYRVAVSEGVRQSMPWKHKARVIYNGIDCNRFQKYSPLRILSECSIEFKENTTIIGHVGSFRLEKNHDTLIRVAAKVIAKEKERVIFVCAGIGERFDEIKQKVVYSGLEDRIVLVGLYKNIPEFLSCCDIFFMPSKFEGLPIACIEAMSAGLPVVVSDVVGLREVVVNDEVGKKFPLDNEDAAVEAILEFMKDKKLRERTGLAAQKHVKAVFSLDTCVEKYNELYGFGNI